MPEGKISAFDSETGRGRIAPDDGGAEVPFKAANVEDRKPGQALRRDQRVSYQLFKEEDAVYAMNIRQINDE